MQEGRPRESLVLFDTPIEVSHSLASLVVSFNIRSIFVQIGPSVDPSDPFRKQFGGKLSGAFVFSNCVKFELNQPVTVSLFELMEFMK